MIKLPCFKAKQIILINMLSPISSVLDDNYTLTLTGADNIDGTGNSSDNIFIDNGNNTIDGEEELILLSLKQK